MTDGRDATVRVKPTIEKHQEFVRKLSLTEESDDHHHATTTTRRDGIKGLRDVVSQASKIINASEI